RGALATFGHPLGQHPSGVAAYGAALDREAHEPVGARPQVAEARADVASSEEERAGAAVLVARDVPPDRRGRVDSRHRGLRGYVDALRYGRLERHERAERAVHPAPVRRLRL